MVGFELLLGGVPEYVVEQEFKFIFELGVVGRVGALAGKRGDGVADEVFEFSEHGWQVGLLTRYIKVMD